MRCRPEIPIAVKPVMDDLPLLKLGGKKMRPKLPDMWKKQAPIPVQALRGEQRAIGQSQRRPE